MGLAELLLVSLDFARRLRTLLREPYWNSKPSCADIIRVFPHHTMKILEPANNTA